MRKLLVLTSLIIVLTPELALAQQATRVPPKPKVVAEAPPKKPFYKRMFGGGDKPADPAPTAAKPAEKSNAKPAAGTPTPKPATAAESSGTTAKPRSKSRRKTAKAAAEKKADATAKPAETAAEEPAETEKPAESPETKPAETTPAESNETAEAKPPKPGTKTSGKKGSKKATPGKLDLTGMDDSTKYRTVRAMALEEGSIRELKSKADAAINESEAHDASLTYNKALFRKIREIEPSLDGYVDQLETAMMKRLSSEKKQ